MGEKRRRGVRVLDEGKKKLLLAKGVKRDDNGKRWTYQSIAEYDESNVLDVKTVQRFFKGEPIDEENALTIFKALGVDALPGVDYEVSPTDKDKKAQLSSDSSQKVTESSAPIKESSTETINIDELVQIARNKIGAYINERCGTMRVLGMARPMVLNDIYTNVNILEKITKLKWSSINELLQNANNENFYRISLGGIREKRVPGLEAVAQHSKLMILGKPGSGKTTFLKYIALQCINGNFEPSRIPLFITLKDFAEANGQPNLLQYLTQTFTNIFKDSQVIEQGRLIVLFDGLDEVKEVDNKRIVKDIKNFTIKYNKNQFIITCRIAAHEYIFENFTDVEITDFNDKQIETFVNKWFNAKNDTSRAKEFINELKDNEPIKELATTPILLTLLCLVFEQKGTFPPNRAELYEEGLDALLNTWDTTRGIERDQLPYKNLSLKQRKDLLSQIAYPTFNGSKYFFKSENIEEYITQYYNSLNIKDDIDTKKVLQAIEAQHGLLIERARGIYSFSHLTFHEYFTAKNIATSTTDNKLLLQLSTHITEKHWREVFILTAGLMRDGADQLLLLMEKEVRSYINTDKLQALLRWAHKETAGFASDVEPYGKRALAISHVHAIAIAHAHGDYNYADAYADRREYDYDYYIGEDIINSNGDYADADAIAKAITSIIIDAVGNVIHYSIDDTIDDTIDIAIDIANVNVTIDNAIDIGGQAIAIANVNAIANANAIAHGYVNAIADTIDNAIARAITYAIANAIIDTIDNAIARDITYANVINGYVAYTNVTNDYVAEAAHGYSHDDPIFDNPIFDALDYAWDNPIAYAIAYVNVTNGYVVEAAAHDIAIAIAIANANTYAHGIAIASAIAYANTYADIIDNTIAYAIDHAIGNAMYRFDQYAYCLEDPKIFKNINSTKLTTLLDELETEIPDIKQPESVYHSFAKRFIETWLHALNLTQEMIDLPKKEIKVLEDYLYANHLIIKCKEAAVSVAPSTWQAIKERMLKID